MVEELIALFREGVEVSLDDREFNRLALSAFAHQFRHNLPYGAFCRAMGVLPDAVKWWTDIPAIPTSAFKEADLTACHRDAITVEYRTSGTTRGAETRGRHLLPDTRLYEASLEPNFRAHLLPDRDSIRVLVNGPTARFFPHSSLGHMHSYVLERFGASGSGVFWREEGPRIPCLLAALRKAVTDDVPVCLLSTAFGMVLLLDVMEAEGIRLDLPTGSRVMDTGGFKGRTREIPRAELYRLYGEHVGIPTGHVVNEYGMTELGSQFYDCTSLNAIPGRAAHDEPTGRVKFGPPWTRVSVVDPTTLRRVEPGHLGLIRIFDLANYHSVCAIQTEDLGVERGGGFEVLGRAAGAELRGCSLSAEEFLTR